MMDVHTWWFAKTRGTPLYFIFFSFFFYRFSKIGCCTRNVMYRRVTFIPPIGAFCVAFVRAAGSRKREKLIERKGIAPLDLVGKMSCFIKENKRYRDVVLAIAGARDSLSFFFKHSIFHCCCCFFVRIFNLNFWRDRNKTRTTPLLSFALI